LILGTNLLGFRYEGYGAILLVEFEGCHLVIKIN